LACRPSLRLPLPLKENNTMRRAHFIVHFAVLMAAFVACASSSFAADSKKESEETRSIFEMVPYVVTGRPFGIIPVNCWFRVGVLSRAIKSPGFSFGAYKNGPALETLGIKSGETLVAIDGKSVVGRPIKELRDTWCYGEIGATVKLTLRGTGKDESVYREVTVKRIALTDALFDSQPKPAEAKP